jgi:hypothetical protein
MEPDKPAPKGMNDLIRRKAGQDTTAAGTHGPGQSKADKPTRHMNDLIRRKAGQEA